MDQTTTETSKFSIPLAIVVAGALIAGALYLTNSNAGEEKKTVETPPVTIEPISSSDHLLGSPNADIIFVEYSDFECPYCKVFHETMHKIIDEYGKDGKVAWVYRHLPIEQLHSKAAKEAEASECAADQGGNEAFWKFADLLFARTESNNRFDLALLPSLAQEIGLDKETFTQCLESGKHTQKIAQAVQEGYAAGAGGTPYSVIVARGENFPLVGAQPYNNVKSAVEAILGNGEAVPAVRP